MKFFIPFAENETQAIGVYDTIKKFLEKELGAVFNDRKVRMLRYTHDGKKNQAEVGEINKVNNEVVIAILCEPGRKLYHVCTPNRGVRGGMSILVGEREVDTFEDFDA